MKPTKKFSPRYTRAQKKKGTKTACITETDTVPPVLDVVEVDQKSSIVTADTVPFVVDIVSSDVSTSKFVLNKKQINLLDKNKTKKKIQ